MSNKTLKIIIAISVLVAVISLSASVLAAATTTTIDPSNVKASSSSADVGGIQSIGNNLVGIVTAVGSVAAVLVLVVLGVKYMMGSAEEKAEYKKTLMPYLIGAVLVFAASVIAGAVYNFSTSIQ